MRTIAFVIPYFGKLPNYFELWLHSCRYNPTVDWIIFTDDRRKFDYPDNVKVIYTSLKTVKKLIQSKFDFSIKLSKAYKLCDYKPAYGYIFSKWIKEYDYWGYCDLDVIFGNIRKFITDDILEQYIKVLKHGHFTLIRNDEIGNSFFKLCDKNCVDYKTVFISDDIWAFDEYGGISSILDRKGIDQYFDNIFADVFYCYDFLHLMFKDSDYVPQIFIWENGKLIRRYAEKMCVKEQEFLYIHLQKRKMKIDFPFNSDINKFMIGPHNFFISNKVLDLEELRRLNPFSLFCFQFIKSRTIELIKTELRKYFKFIK